MVVVGKVKKYYPRLKDSGLPMQAGALNSLGEEKPNFQKPSPLCFPLDQHSQRWSQIAVSRSPHAKAWVGRATREIAANQRQPGRTGRRTGRSRLWQRGWANSKRALPQPLQPLKPLGGCTFHIHSAAICNNRGCRAPGLVGDRMASCSLPLSHARFSGRDFAGRSGYPDLPY